MTGILRRTLTIAAFAVTSCAAQHLEVVLADQSLLRSRLESGQVAQSERQATIEKLFRDAGCPVEEQPVDKKSANVVCKLPGSTSSTVVVGAHFDFADEGKGIVDNWSGAAMLASLYQAVKSNPRQHTFVFVAFAKEEQGLVGASRYVRMMTREEKAGLHAFVNLECLGLSPTKVWLSRATPELVDRLKEIAGAMGSPLNAVNVDRVGDDDTHPFLSAHLPVITIHSVTQDTWPILHSPRDQLNAIDFEDYSATYKLTAFYLAYLDIKLTGPAGSPPHK